MNLEGVLLIDKTKGPSSFDIVKKVRAISGVKRVGHAGTLDPLASGLLVVALGRYTKLCNYLCEGSKVYEAIIELGTTTTTDDQEGEVLKQNSCEHLKLLDIQKACNNFVGTIEQKPPRFSAVKIAGRRAYSMARAEENFELLSRPVTIFGLELKEVSLPLLVIRVHCSKGTYIRSLARDIGEYLGVGAHAKAIRRVKSGGFDILDALTLAELDKESLSKHILCGRAALGDIKTVNINAIDRDNAIHGRMLSQTCLGEAPSVAF